MTNDLNFHFKVKKKEYSKHVKMAERFYIHLLTRTECKTSKSTRLPKSSSLKNIYTVTFAFPSVFVYIPWSNFHAATVHTSTRFYKGTAAGRINE